MKVTIAVDDISLPLPPMRTPGRAPDRSSRSCCELLADHGVDDVHIIIANCAAPPDDRGGDAAHGGREDLRRVLPGPLLQPRRRGSRRHGRARQDRATARWSRSTAAPPRATCVIYVNINFVPMDGGHKSVGVGLCGYERLRGAPQRRKTIRDSDSYMDPTRSRAAHADRAHRPGGREAPQGLPHRDRAQQPHVRRPARRSSMKNEDDFTEVDRLKFQAMQLDALEACRARRSAKIFHAHARAPTS